MGLTAQNGNDASAGMAFTKPAIICMLVRLGDSTQCFMEVDSLVICKCWEMSKQNELFNRCAETCRRVDLEQEDQMLTRKAFEQRAS